jgi:uncharacterized protein (TIGR02145 family)
MKWSKYVWLIACLIFTACQPDADPAPFVTEDGYMAVRIGNQIWMVDNLDKEIFNNGDSIAEVMSDADWVRMGKEGKPAMCWYENEPGSTKGDGRLYNWYAVNDPRGLAPPGWRIPAESDWNELAEYLGGAREAGNALKDTLFWKDASGQTHFSALPGGGRDEEGLFRDGEMLAAWWIQGEGQGRAIGPRPGLRNWWWFRNNGKKENGFNVRCLKE